MPLVALIAGCDVENAAPPAVATEECGTWASVGEPFALTWCTSCHSSALPEGLRYSAPVGLDFDTLDAVREHAEVVATAALGDSPRMPPAGGVPAAERARMAAWLACGAPGDAHRIEPGAWDGRLVGADYVIGGYTEPLPGQLEIGFSRARLGDLELYLAAGEGDTLDLTGWSLTVPDGDALLGSASVVPGLPLWPPERAGAGEVDTEVTWDGAVSGGPMTWTLSVFDEPDPDPRFGQLDTFVVELVADDGSALSFWLSDRAGLVALDLAWGPLSDDRVDRLLMLSASPPSDRSGTFAMRVGDGFIVRRTVLTRGAP